MCVCVCSREAGRAAGKFFVRTKELATGVLASLGCPGTAAEEKGPRPQSRPAS